MLVCLLQSDCFWYQSWPYSLCISNTSFHNIDKAAAQKYACLLAYAADALLSALTDGSVQRLQDLV